MTPVVLLCLALATMVVSGCASGLAGGATAPAAAVPGPAVAYRDGESSQVHAGTYDQVWNAALSALTQMNIAVVDSKRDALGGEIKARQTADNAEVDLRVEPIERNTTRVRVRVGPAGDQPASEQIQRGIDTTLARG
jgi:uncharacterized lipoprotein